MQLNCNFKKKRIAVIFLGPFPKGNVSTIRILSYCIALSKYGCFVKVYILAPTDEAKINKVKRGIYRGVHYEYVSLITWKKNNTSQFIKACYYLLGLLKIFPLLTKDNISLIFTYHTELLFNFLVSIYSKIKGIAFVLDKTEYPKGYTLKSGKVKLVNKIEYGFFDGIVTISKELFCFYSKLNKKVFLLPMTVDYQRFSNSHSIRKPDENPKIITVVFGTHDRDCIKDSIFAFEQLLKLSSPSDNYKLNLVGNFEILCRNFPENLLLIDYINKNALKDFIDFRGEVENSLVVNILANSTVLLSTPRFFISGGFPTKIGEYLLSSVPVVVTDVGELGEYLENKKDVIFANPGDIMDIAGSIFYLLQNPDLAKKIGENGAISAMKHFNADRYIADLLEFTVELKKL